MPLQLVKVNFSAFSVVIKRHPMIMFVCAATANNKQSMSVCSSDLLATPEARDHAVSLAWLMLNSMDAVRSKLCSHQPTLHDLSVGPMSATML